LNDNRRSSMLVSSFALRPDIWFSCVGLWATYTFSWTVISYVAPLNENLQFWTVCNHYNFI
jgi:hypothetical protein